MHFATPSWLWLLWLLPPLALLYALAANRRGAAMRRFAEERFVQHLAPQRSPARAALRAVLLLVALLLMVGAAAGPRWGFAWEDVERRGVDIVVALDLSRSMLSQDLPPDRLTAAKRELSDLVDLLEGDRVGLVVFAGMAFTQAPLTLDYGTVGVFLDQLDPTWVPVGGTDLGAAIDAAVKTFIEEDRSSKAVILITDGEDHGGRLQEAAQAAKEQGVHIFVVGIGKPEGGPVPDGVGGFVKDDRGKVVLSKLDEGALKEVALTTGGTYVRRSEGIADLQKLYLEDIKGTLEARALTSSRQRRWEERFQWLLLPALLLLFVEPLLGPRRSVASRGGHVPTASKLAAALALLLLPATAQAGWFDDPVRDAHRLYGDGDFDGALKRLLRAQTDDPTDRRIDYDIGHAHYRLGAFDDAETAFRAATSAADRDLAADAWFGAGNALFQQGSYLEAIAAYEECLGIRPDDEDAAINRDIAQRAWEKRMDEANQQNEEQEEQPPQDQQESEQDGEATEEEQQSGEGQDGEQQEKQEQQQGQGYSEQEQQAPDEGDSEDQRDGSEEREDQSSGEDDGQADEESTPEAAAEQEVQTGGKAEAADIDREDPSDAERETADGELSHDTVEDEGAGDEPRAIVEGALSEEEAEALLRALRADQEARRAERTRREAARGRRAAEKDW